MQGISFAEPKSFFIGVDSDGCVFDTMDLKHKNIFIPQAIESLRLDGIADAYRSVAESVNLYSRSRGLNRFEAIVRCLEILRKDPDLQSATTPTSVPDPAPIQRFIESGRPLANDSFAEYVTEKTAADQIGPDDLRTLRAVLDWSAKSNERIAATIKGVPPFAGVRDSLARAKEMANTMVVSATPGEALTQEWGNAGLLEYIDVVAGQEVGPKSTQIAEAMRSGFSPDRSILIGDAPGDHAAAEKNGILFFPIVPGGEEESWDRLLNEGLDRLKDGTFRGAFQDGIVRAYYETLDRWSE
jgi:phosphoglycolate phosphatase-like HAD superfamily hydrolase